MRLDGAGQDGTVSAGKRCSACDTVNPTDTHFCYACGLRLGGHTPPSAVAVASASSPGSPTATGHTSNTSATRLVVVRRDGSDGVAYPIVGEQFDIGRTDGDLLFDDPHLAPRHARVLTRAGHHVVVPLDIRNGVYLRLRQAIDLTDGDHMLLGKEVLRFELLPDVERTLRPAVEHGIVFFGTPVRPPWGRLKQLTAAGTARDVYHLTRSEIVLGREQGDVVFSDDEFLSRRHAQIQYRAGKVTLADLGSSNGTFLRLRSQHALVPGDMIRMGDELLRFELG